MILFNAFRENADKYYKGAMDMEGDADLPE
jgi:hypothetical protein